MFNLNQKNNKRTIMIIGLISIIIILIGLLLCIYLWAKSKDVEPLAPEEASSEVPEVTTPKVLYNLVGTIKEIEETVIVFEAVVPQVNEKGEIVPKNELRRILISPTTEFTRLTIVTHEETGKQTIKEIKITFKDFKVGDYIEVLSSQNISEEKEFRASKIRIPLR